jgi:hypothetical protein
MAASDLEKRLDSLIKKITDRNKTVQEKKQSGPWGWVVGIVLALISLVGIGVAMWLASRRAKELAAAKTKIEQDKVDQDARALKAKKVTLLRDREKALEELKKRERAIQERNLALKVAEREHAERQKKLEGLKAWGAINEA